MKVSNIHKNYDNKQLITSEPAERQHTQEYHNAGHALWYLSTIVHSLTNGKPEWSDGEKTERIIAHLSHLREFISDEDGHFKSIITHLLEALKTALPNKSSQWVHFIYTNWNLIREFAKRYGGHDKCFSQDSYKKIGDLVCRKHWPEEQSSKLLTDIESIFRAWFNNRMTVILMLMQHSRLRDSRTMMKIEFFLNDIEHHFVDSHAPKHLWDAFRYLLISADRV